MKFHNAVRHGKSLFRLTVSCLIAIMISSCATSHSNPTAGTQSAQTIGNSWKKVSSNPPTWYPRGIAADHPTDHSSGEWVYTDDVQGARFFIPLHGLSAAQRKALVAEALAARDPDKVREVSNQEAGRKIATGAGVVVAAPVLAVGAVGIYAIGGLFGADL